MKPYEHALSSAKKWGGTPEDYLSIHQVIDQAIRIAKLRSQLKELRR